jgi:hypothetical protein
MGDYIITGGLVVLLIALTVCFLIGYGANLIAGFNTLAKDEKEKFDKLALCRFVGKVLIPFDIAIIVLFVGTLIHASWTIWAGIFICVVGFPYVIAMSVYANTGNRFGKQ